MLLNHWSCEPQYIDYYTSQMFESPGGLNYFPKFVCKFVGEYKQRAVYKRYVT